ncbi:MULTISPECIES: M2 family metallopeptidase [unclassified Sphingomonas]|uniref:M2 family metallopeptidase n=1 Tax=unclassified Sphingomonas TaxID=196159 RepID=UPI0006F3F23D|nr:MULTISPECIES: M2 family metallopeptidase [unclassified Sphingomonas]KQX21582.1 peptidyl-dipeptidase [Sphingomonas sp. Root1294]KQY72899.1 peptidyl-dipeptidase [Sphingomonas sp. Root50]KRB88308.1 peptidyl-dipeptidase [Sphingomonas sp. Root720]
MKISIKAATSALALAALLATAPALAQDRPAAATASSAAPTVAEADAFVADAEKQLADLGIYGAQAAWINATYITDDTDAVNARVGAEFTEMQVRYASGAARFDGLKGLSYDTRRKLDILKQSIVLPAPSTPGAARELNDLATRLQSAYGKGKGTLRGQEINGSDIEAEMGTNRNPAELKEMWVSWHDNVGKPMRGDYAKLVEIANKGAVDLGYQDLGAMWRAGYDMPADDFAKMMDRLWTQVKPLYDALHCYTRMKLNEKYGDAVQAKTGPIRADLLGNMWAQEWGNIYDIVAPTGAGDLGFDTGELLVAKQYDPVKMVKTGEGFYTSLGFAKLPDSFWTRSQITKPRDREVVCHASAWDIDNVEDLRIKMCTKVNADDFVTIHHELGHNFYQRAYNKQPYLYLNGANDGFHEAIGDFIALSVTPDYLVKIGLLDPAKVPSADKDIGLLLRQAMDKVAFLPFGLLMDKWRWGVFSGQTTPASYNKAWTDLRLQYQGIVPPEARDEGDFDPGAKYHIPGNTPYARYFLARILQFQFYKAACEQAGWKGPLHRCSFYGNKEVGAKLDAMLKMGASKPWPDALEAFTGSREIDGSAMIAYFKPLMAWLQKQNKGQRCGW